MPRRWLQGSAQGFNPGNPQNNEFALKGREADLLTKARTYCCAKNYSAQLRRANNVEHRSTCGQNTGWKPMLHWSSGLASDLPKPCRELSPCTWSDDATALM
jgi:hypothetical protein